jgi:hypothetical protein
MTAIRDGLCSMFKNRGHRPLLRGVKQLDVGYSDLHWQE